MAERWCRSRSSTLARSRLREAKAALDHGEFEAMVERDLPFRPSLDTGSLIACGGEGAAPPIVAKTKIARPRGAERMRRCRQRRRDGLRCYSLQLRDSEIEALV